MKENKLEAFLVTIMAIGIVGIIAFTIYKVSSSTRNLRMNEPVITKKNPASSSSQNNNMGGNNIEGASQDPPKKEEVLLSTFSTNIYDNDVNRVENIALAIASINGKVLEKDEVFSFNETVGPMDYDHGYKDSTAFDSSREQNKSARWWYVPNKQYNV